MANWQNRAKQEFKASEMKQELAHEDMGFDDEAQYTGLKGRLSKRRIARNPVKRNLVKTVKSRLDAQRLYLTVPYDEKDQAKREIGAKWDDVEKKWYVNFSDAWDVKEIIGKIGAFHPNWVEELTNLT